MKTLVVYALAAALAFANAASGFLPDKDAVKEGQERRERVSRAYLEAITSASGSTPDFELVEKKLTLVGKNWLAVTDEITSHLLRLITPELELVEKKLASATAITHELELSVEKFSAHFNVIEESLSDEIKARKSKLDKRKLALITATEDYKSVAGQFQLEEQKAAREKRAFVTAVFNDILKRSTLQQETAVEQLFVSPAMAFDQFCLQELVRIFSEVLKGAPGGSQVDPFELEADESVAYLLEILKAKLKNSR